MHAADARGEPTVLVTGGASGIGRAVVDAVLGAGWHAVALDRDEAALARLGTDWARAGGKVTLEHLDVTDEAKVIECVGRAGPLAGVVNSAAIGAVVPALDTNLDLFRQVLEVNVLGMFTVSREAAKHMCRRRTGSIVNIGSVSGLRGNAGRVAYGASKGAVTTMTQVMAVEFGALGVRVNAIAPGAIETPLVREHHTGEQRAAWNSLTPQGHYGAPDDIAQAALFLLDDTRSGYLTGQVLAVDGGFTAAGVLPASPITR
ncbi:SDR family NAD(P)-dependent oxidoreductase [Amycolatopsis sp. Poz14]|uniref:SDR family NAD(P)-dependent oxidoreductase n=1 Tax=Amycolatopsis sp. Poz14 TaxID=1447705 RepID=UPI001EE96071|nr:SDR family NAD(P)-dependent oxidoreductase [Amycolatopsis sp. Poz14]MCG3753946.1 SDR family oxidoreductase [Amycolatopsis sp. Poz14]